MRKVIDIILIIAISVIIISLVLSLSANAQSDDVERAILIILQARSSHVYWWERLEWDKTTDITYIGDRAWQAYWIDAYDHVLTVLYAQLGTKYYAYDYLKEGK